MNNDSPGQLLALRGDLTRLECHAVVVPMSADLDVTTPWLPLVSELHPQADGEGWHRLTVDVPPGWGEDDRTLRGPVVGRRQVWLTRTDAWDKDGAWVAASLVQAVERAAAHFSEVTNRAVPLVGVPLAGSGAGGLADRRGEVVAAAVPALQDAAVRLGVDVALVLYDDQDFAAVQAARTDTYAPGTDTLTAAEIARADALGDKAAREELVLFLGAGVSMAAGLPSWNGLLRELAEAATQDHQALSTLAAPDAAQILHDELGDRFHSLLGERFRLSTCAASHMLLAGLRADAVVTTNYDNGYELAAECLHPSDHALRVLPRQHAQAGSPWLLKMHGDVEVPDSIVLTKSHYLDYADAHSPLTGMVQALLMTRHMLFVGFSLIDDNFARLAHQVRRLMKDAHPLDRKAGTVLALQADKARERLWRDDLDHLSLADERPDNEPARANLVAARRLELFLDRLSWRAASTRHGREVLLLDGRHDAMRRSRAEVKLRRRLNSLREKVTAEEQETAAWRIVEEALATLGGRNKAPGPQRR